MERTRSGRIRKKSSMLVDYDTPEKLQNEPDSNEDQGETSTAEELLESLDSLVESHFSDSLASTIVSSNGALHLSIWAQPRCAADVESN